ncbi:hypothetical protein [Streptomyces sp. NPDC005262]|uniref:hypothetical protein n=1 Tax=Streptomyces sp. NPDC005262 TaxID=3364710 RepID=UPI0036A1C19F
MTTAPGAGGIPGRVRRGARDRRGHDELPRAVRNTRRRRDRQCQGGLSFGIGATLVNRVLLVTSRAPSLSGSFATVALNAGAFLGPLLAGIATVTTRDYRDAAWVSAVLAATAAVVILASRRRAAHPDVTESR